MDAPKENSPLDESTLPALAALADAADGDLQWPSASWRLLRTAGVLTWNVPEAFGGRGLGLTARLRGYEQLAGACLTVTFILSQREAAVRRIISHARQEIQVAWLPRLARDKAFLTVGLSQLTTSRQHQGPALSAMPQGTNFILDGVIPWVTGADHADALVVGATLPDGLQILTLLPRRRAGVEVEAPMDLCALRGSQTTQVRCRGVHIESEHLLAGPAPQVLGAAAGGLETSCLALGLAGAAVDHLLREAEGRAYLRPVAERFESARLGLRRRLYSLAEHAVAPADANEVRVQANTLALQATQALLTASKGSGFVRPHPAQRWARQALFFLVWSCPRPAAEGTLAHLMPDLDATAPSCG